METDEQQERRRHVERSGWRRPWVIIAIIVVAAAIGAALFFAFNSGSSDDTTDTGNGGGVVELPQNPSLRLFEEDGTWYVENDGNVTMSEIEVADGSGAVVCELGRLSPDDRAACDEASGDGLVATGSGPQGQPVEVGPAG